MPPRPPLLRLATRKWTPLPFLCPAWAPMLAANAKQKPALSPLTPSVSCRHFHIESTKAQPSNETTSPIPLDSKLPVNCPGCGAYSQNSDSNQPGYYAAVRRNVKAYIAQKVGSHEQELESKETSREKSGQSTSETENPPILSGNEPAKESPGQAVPLCDRCHDLLHHNKGVPIFHPNMKSLQNVIAETPHNRNHIYHVIDAADFPMSLIPRIQKHLDLTPQRGRNRRAKMHNSKGGEQADLSFIITRSDLLAPRKEQVDKLMPVLTEILRDALGRDAEAVRLGNVKCVSAKRGWWTKDLKEDIFRRGGGQWMVGKVNVGKSNLFEAVFPKDRADKASLSDLRHDMARGEATKLAKQYEPENLTDENEGRISDEALAELLSDDVSVKDPRPAPVLEPVNNSQEHAETTTTLPPAAPEEAFPTMPTVSHLPGTTAQPIRLRFGGGKGELIDLPGLDRRDLTNYVQEEQQQNLVMRSRISPSQVSIKPGQSLMVGDLIRITPVTPAETVFLAAAFVPLSVHVTNSEKGAAIQSQVVTSPAVQALLKDGVGQEIKSAGWFELRWDVTKQRTGSLTRSNAGGVRTNTLPFVVYAADILIEGVGWVEMTAQVRKKQLEVDPSPPMVEVFSPFGKHIEVRRPLGSFMLGGHMRKPVSQRSQRPRKSMKGVKKAAKKAKREAAKSEK